MEPKFQTSFIPKKPSTPDLGVTLSSSVKVANNASILSIVATILFISSILVSAGLFAYEKVLNSQIVKLGEDIEAARSAFKPEEIQELIDNNARISFAKNILEKHVAISGALSLMQNLVNTKTRFLSLDYRKKDKIGGLTITGQAQNYNSLADQNNFFLESEFLINPRFSDFKPDENGYIGFDFHTSIRDSVVSYGRDLVQSTN